MANLSQADTHLLVYPSRYRRSIQIGRFVSNPVIQSALGTDANVEVFDVFDLLRKGTAGLHQRIERRVPVFREGFNLENYTQLVEQFLGFWAPVEERLSKLRSLRVEMVEPSLDDRTEL